MHKNCLKPYFTLALSDSNRNTVRKNVFHFSHYLFKYDFLENGKRFLRKTHKKADQENRDFFPLSFFSKFLSYSLHVLYLNMSHRIAISFFLSLSTFFCILTSLFVSLYLFLCLYISIPYFVSLHLVLYLYIFHCTTGSIPLDLYKSLCISFHCISASFSTCITSLSISA